MKRTIQVVQEITIFDCPQCGGEIRTQGAYAEGDLCSSCRWTNARKERRKQARVIHSFLLGAKIIKIAVNHERCLDCLGDGLDYFTIETEDGTQYNIGHDYDWGGGSQWCITKI